MSEQVFFTSDQHYGHSTILTIGNGRPFETLEEMDDTMIYRHNSMVGKNDRVYYLGDFSFYGKGATIALLARLNGHKHFVRGNHDSPMVGSEYMFDSFQDYKEIKVAGQKLILFHFPILSWYSVGKGSWHLHGHCHNNLPEETDMARLDIGVDGHDFYPWSFDEIAEVLTGRTGVPGDHH